MGVLVKLALVILRKKKVSVILNVDVTGNIILKSNNSYMESLNINGHIYNYDGTEFKPPKGKFSIRY